MRLQVRLWLAATLALVATLATTSCSTKGMHTQEQAAFIAGQEQTFRMLQENGIAIVRLVGPFKRQVLSWRNGLTVAQAIVEGGYAESGLPAQIVVRRGTQNLLLEPAALLNGEDVPLNPGDLLEVVP